MDAVRLSFTAESIRESNKFTQFNSVIYNSGSQLFGLWPLKIKLSTKSTCDPSSVVAYVQINQTGGFLLNQNNF